MRIVIDMQGAQTAFSAHRGVGRYTLCLVEEMLKHAGDNEIFLALNGRYGDRCQEIRQLFSGIIAPEKIITWQQFYAFSAVDEASKNLQEIAEISREVFLNSFNPDVILSTNLQEGLFDATPTSVRKIASDAFYVTTLHDVIPLDFKDEYLADPLVKKWYFEKIRAAADSDLIITDSEYSKSEIIKHGIAKDEDVLVVTLAIDREKFNPHFTVDHCTAVKEKFAIDKEYILYTGGMDQHKNITRLYQALAMLPAAARKNCVLVMVGKELFNDQNNQYKILQKLKIEQSVIFTGFVSDQELGALYQGCRYFIFPSLREGFGLPVLEAMSCGAAVLSANNSSVAEINPLTEGSFDPLNVQDMCAKMSRGLTDNDYIFRLQRYSLQRAQVFSWRDSAEKLLAELESRFGPGKAETPHDCRYEREPIETALTLFTQSPACQGYVDSDLEKIARSWSESYIDIHGRRRKICIDVSATVSSNDRTGIQRVVRAISNALVSESKLEYDVIPVCKKVDDAFFNVASDFMQEIVGGQFIEITDNQVSFHAGDILLFLDLHPALAISHVNNTRYLKNKGVRVFHVVYDLLPLKFPEYFWPALCSEFEQWLQAIMSASGVICISRSVAAQMSAYLASHADKRLDKNYKVAWFHLGADMKSSLPSTGLPQDSSSVLAKIASGLSFLVVGTLEPRKRQSQVLQAFELLWSQGQEVNLVFVGKQGWGVDSLVSHIQGSTHLGRHLFWLADASDEYLDSVYRHATCLIAASEDEGFGLPLIEAAQYGLHILARDIPVFKEVAADHARYFTGLQPGDLASSLLVWLKLYQKNRISTADAMPWLNWKDSAQQLLQAMLSDHSVS